ncbi:MAG: hypothetical protein HOV71_07915 [Hamadaea sp.]|nr:hypothetical protein [Hamadaea sp.]NUT05276.1 hypothetical protein [Hamadaea sp.]
MTMPPPPETPQEPPTGWTPPGQPGYPQPPYPVAPPPFPPQQPYPPQGHPQQAQPQQPYPPQPFQPQPFPGAAPTAPPAAPVAPRKRRTGLIVTIVVVVLVLCCGVTGGGGWWAYSKYQEGATDREMAAVATSVHGYPLGEHRVIFTLSGSGSVTVEYSDGTRQTSVVEGMPWRKTVVVPKDDFLVWVRVDTSSGGNVQRCTIDVDGSPAVAGGLTGSQVVCAVSFSS